MLLIASLFSSESRLLILDLGKLSVRTEKPALRSSARPGGDAEAPNVSWQPLTLLRHFMHDALYIFLIFIINHFVLLSLFKV